MEFSLSNAEGLIWALQIKRRIKGVAMEKSELPFLTVAELGQRIAIKEVSPVEATEAYLERIQQVDSKLNSYITVTADEAMKQAREAEHAINRGDYRGPLHGVPVGIKDQFWTRGIRTTAGSTIMADFVPDEDATVVSRLKSAGAVILGKLNLSEFAMGNAFRHPYGRPLNPWDLTRNPGTSSSGSGAATAACLCATSLGEDTGGSIRGPAAFCGLVGLRPSWGRVSRYGLVGAVWSMDTIGPISRTVEDCAITFQAIAGYDPKDPYTWNAPVPDYRASLTGNIRGLRIGVIKERAYSDVLEPDIRDGVLKAIEVLGELGATVTEVSIPLTVYSSVINTVISQVEGAAVHHDGIRAHAADYDYNNRVRVFIGNVTPAQAYYKAQKLRAVLRQQLLDALGEVDCLVLPAQPIQASKVPSAPGVGSKQEVKSGLFGRTSFSAPANLAGVPALSVGCGFTSDKLPIGLQVLGRPFDEVGVMNVAHAYQQATTWHNMRPPI